LWYDRDTYRFWTQGIEFLLMQLAFTYMRRQVKFTAATAQRWTLRQDWLHRNHVFRPASSVLFPDARLQRLDPVKERFLRLCLTRWPDPY